MQLYTENKKKLQFYFQLLAFTRNNIIYIKVVYIVSIKQA